MSFASFVNFCRRKKNVHFESVRIFSSKAAQFRVFVVSWRKVLGTLRPPRVIQGAARRSPASCVVRLCALHVLWGNGKQLLTLETSLSSEDEQLLWFRE